MVVERSISGHVVQEVLEQLAEDRLSLEDFDDLTDGKSSSNISIAPGGLWGMPEHRVQCLKSTVAENCLEATYITHLELRNEFGQDLS